MGSRGCYMCSDAAGGITMKTCESCLFFKVLRSPLGHCRRAAPRSIKNGGRGMWPLVHYQEWCGDYRSDAATESGSEVVTADRVRAEREQAYGKCCGGYDILCSGPQGCIVVEAMRRSAA